MFSLDFETITNELPLCRQVQIELAAEFKNETKKLSTNTITLNIIQKNLSVIIDSIEGGGSSGNAGSGGYLNIYVERVGSNEGCLNIGYLFYGGPSNISKETQVYNTIGDWNNIDTSYFSGNKSLYLNIPIDATKILSSVNCSFTSVNSDISDYTNLSFDWEPVDSSNIKIIIKLGGMDFGRFLFNTGDYWNIIDLFCYRTNNPVVLFYFDVTKQYTDGSTEHYINHLTANIE